MMNRFVRVSLIFALLSATSSAQFPSAPTNPGSTCAWVGAPGLVGQLCNTTVTPQGESVVLKKTTCFKAWYGLVEWTQKTFEDVCEEVTTPGLIYIISLVPLIIITTPPMTSSCYKRICTGTSVASGNVLAIDVCTDYSYCIIPEIEPGGQTTSTETFGTHANLVHDVPDAISATFDGDPLIQGDIIPLRDLGPGTYTYVIQRSNGVDVSTHVATIIVEASHSLTQIDSDPSDSILPTAVVEYTNDSEYAVDIDLQSTSLIPSLETQLLNNQAHVLPGQTIQREVSFTTLPGHAVPEGAALAARVDVYSISSLHTLLASTTVGAASCSVTMGSGEDLRMGTEVNGGGLDGLCAKAASVGDTYTVKVDSPNGTFVGANAMVYFDLFMLGDTLVRFLPAFPEIQLTSALQVLAPSTPLPSGGLTLSAPLVPGLSGYVFRVQGAVFSPLAENGMFAVTDAHDVDVD